MADIKVGRTSSPWPWVIGLIVAALVVWALFALFDRSNDTARNTPATVAMPAAPTATRPVSSTTGAPVVPVASATTAIAGASSGALGSIVDTPASYTGQRVTVSGTVRVAQVSIDRGFWIEDEGKRVFVLITQSPGMESAVDLSPGQSVQLSGTVAAPPPDTSVEDELDAQTRKIIEQQPVFLEVPAHSIVVLDQRSH